MKYRTTKREITNGYDKRISVSYCNLQNILSYFSPAAYTAGTYGWNADIYEVSPGVAIVTGYRPFGNVKPDYETCMKYNKRAEDIGYDKKWEERKREAEEILGEFVKEVTQG